MASSEEAFVLKNAIEFGFRQSFHANNIKISGRKGLQAERINPFDPCHYGVAYGAKVLKGTTEFEVEITTYETQWWKGTLKLGVMQCKAGSKIKHSDTPQRSPGTTNYCIWHSGWEDFRPSAIENKLVGYSGPTRMKYGFTNLHDLREGDRLGLRVSHDGVLTFFVNGKSQGVAAQGVYQDGYDLYPVVDVNAKCEAVRITRAVQYIDTRRKSSCSTTPQKDSETQSRDRLMSDEIVHYESEIASLQQERDAYKDQVSHLMQQSAEKGKTTEAEQLRQQIFQQDQIIKTLKSEREKLRCEVAEKDRFIHNIQSEREGLVQQLTTLQQQVQKKALQLQSDQLYQSNFLEVPREEVSLNMHKTLGTGAWGFVVEGTFRGQRVAVKCLHDMIQEPEYIEVIRKEIGIMAQIRHPNLVLLIAAVIEAENGPLIIIELLDMSLRKAYEKNLIRSSSKLNIVRDIASALNYLHLHHHGEIIHRDVSSANVLLEAKPNNQWKAKLSDFGSAKLAMEAKTTGPGAPVYAAPEVKREMGIRQTAKVDVYSYGILVCEVTMEQFPMEKRLPSMMQAIRDRSMFIHGLITACMQEHPDNRPTMSHVLMELNKLRPN